MTELSNEIIGKLNDYIKYVNVQENEINNVEKTKEKYVNAFFSN